MKPPKLTRLEMQIMEALWTRGRLSIREIQESIPARNRPAYSTVQTTVYRLEVKRALKRVRKISNAHIFEAVVGRAAARGTQDSLKFEIASVKPADPNARGMRFSTTGAAGLDANNVTLRHLIEFAYNVRSFQVSGGADWIGNERWVILAKPDLRRTFRREPSIGPKKNGSPREFTSARGHCLPNAFTWLYGEKARSFLYTIWY